MLVAPRRSFFVSAALAGSAPHLVAARDAATIVPAGQGPTHWMVGDRLTRLLGGDATGGAFALMQIFVVPGGGPPPHIHGRESETFHVIDGEATLTIGDQVVRAGPGTTAHVPAGMPHTFRNDGTVPLRMGMVIAPAGLEGFFAEAGQPGRIDDPTPAPADAARIARIIEVAGRYGTSFLPPPR